MGQIKALSVPNRDVGQLIMLISRMWIILCLLRIMHIVPCIRYRFQSISRTADAKKISLSRDIYLYGSRGTRGSLINEETKIVSHKRVGGTRHRGGVSAGEEYRSVPIRPQFDAAGFYLRSVSSIPEELATDMTK